MFEKLKQENHEKFQENFKKRIKLAQDIATASTIEAARALMSQMKLLEDELKEIDAEQGFLTRFGELNKANPTPAATPKPKKGIGLT